MGKKKGKKGGLVDAIDWKIMTVKQLEKHMEKITLQIEMEKLGKLDAINECRKLKRFCLISERQLYMLKRELSSRDNSGNDGIQATERVEGNIKNAEVARALMNGSTFARECLAGQNLYWSSNYGSSKEQTTLFNTLMTRDEQIKYVSKLYRDITKAIKKDEQEEKSLAKNEYMYYCDSFYNKFSSLLEIGQSIILKQQTSEMEIIEIESEIIKNKFLKNHEYDFLYLKNFFSDLIGRLNGTVKQYKNAIAKRKFNCETLLTEKNRRTRENKAMKKFIRDSRKKQVEGQGILPQNKDYLAEIDYVIKRRDNLEIEVDNYEWENEMLKQEINFYEKDIEQQLKVFESAFAEKNQKFNVRQIYLNRQMNSLYDEGLFVIGKPSHREHMDGEETCDRLKIVLANKDKRIFELFKGIAKAKTAINSLKTAFTSKILNMKPSGLIIDCDK